MVSTHQTLSSPLCGDWFQDSGLELVLKFNIKVNGLISDNNIGI